MMRIEQSDIVLPIVNYDKPSHDNVFSKHGTLFNGTCKRALVVGPSGCGKTNTIVTLLVHPNGLRFENIYIYCKSLYQPKYRFIQAVFQPMKEIGYQEYSNDKDIISPQEIKPNSVIIFDDVASCNQNIIRDFFSFGRHKNTDCFYICQTYSSIPKQLIRDNANLLIIFKQDLLNLKHIFEDHVNLDMTFSQFKELCSICWEDQYGFLVMDKDCTKSKGRYRKGFDKYIYP